MPMRMLMRTIRIANSIKPMDGMGVITITIYTTFPTIVASIPLHVVYIPQWATLHIGYNMLYLYHSRCSAVVSDT